MNWYVQSGTGTIVTTAKRLTPWLLDLRLLGQAPIEAGPEHLLTYLPSSRDPVALFQLTDAAKDMFESLVVPQSFETLGTLIADREAVALLLGKFVEIGVVRISRAA
jgi:hypothetical protein